MFPEGGQQTELARRGALPSSCIDPGLRAHYPMRETEKIIKLHFAGDDGEESSRETHKPI